MKAEQMTYAPTIDTNTNPAHMAYALFKYNLITSMTLDVERIDDRSNFFAVTLSNGHELHIPIAGRGTYTITHTSPTGYPHSHKEIDADTAAVIRSMCAELLGFYETYTATAPAWMEQQPLTPADTAAIPYA